MYWFSHDNANVNVIKILVNTGEFMDKNKHVHCFPLSLSIGKFNILPKKVSIKNFHPIAKVKSYLTKEDRR